MEAFHQILLKSRICFLTTVSVLQRIKNPELRKNWLLALVTGIGKSKLSLTPRSAGSANNGRSKFILGGISGFTLPLTVSAWTSSLKKQPKQPSAGNPDGIKLMDWGDSHLLKDLVDADEMYKSGEMTLNDSIYENLKKHEDKNEPELLWRLARSTYEKSKKIVDAEAKKKLVEQAHLFVKKALSLDEKNFASHKWMAILLNHLSSLQGLKEQIKQSFTVKYHMERAIELNPKDPTSAYLLGQWCFSVAEVPWYQQKIASAIFATPPSSTYEEALKYFLQAENIQPLFYSMNLLMLAKTHMKLGHPGQAKACLEKLAALPLKTEEDFLARKEGRAIRDKISPGSSNADDEKAGQPQQQQQQQ